MPAALRAGLERETEHLTHVEKQRLGIYHGYHRRERVSRVWIDRWAQRFAPLAELIGFALSLRNKTTSSWPSVTSTGPSAKKISRASTPNQ